MSACSFSVSGCFYVISTVSYVVYHMLCVLLSVIGIAEVYPVWSYMYVRTHVGDITPPPPYQKFTKTTS